MTRHSIRLQLAAASLVALTACGPSEVLCRAPDFSPITVEGDPYAACEMSFSACEDESNINVFCSNDTFDGDYECSWTRLAGVHTSSGSFHSTDICTLDEAGAGADFSERSGLVVVVVSE